MAEIRESAVPEGQRNTAKPALAAAGGVLGAVAASSCCIVPLVLFGFGVSGAWIGNLTALAPYQPIFVAVTLGFLAGGFWTMYRKPRAAATNGSRCAPPAARRFVEIVLWSAAVLVAAAMAFPYVAPWLLDV